MLSCYENKRIRITTTDGSVWTGIADVYASGYGLVEFGRAEESIRIRDVQIFKSDILKIETLSNKKESTLNPRQYDELMGELLEKACWIVDILPEQVASSRADQFFSLERYYLQPERLRKLRTKFADILLRLNCYYEMAVSFDCCESWEKDPDPETFSDRMIHFAANTFLRAVFEEHRTMIDLEPDDTYMTVYNPDCELLEKIQKLAYSEGLFVWGPQQ